MGYRLREIAAGRKFSQELRLDAISQAVSAETVAAVLAAHRGGGRTGTQAEHGGDGLSGDWHASV